MALGKVNEIRAVLGKEPLDRLPEANPKDTATKSRWMRSCPIAQATGARVFENRLEFRTPAQARKVSSKLKLGLYADDDESPETALDDLNDTFAAGNCKP
jgi:hypothetical protein